jgi:hypothetical protein
MERDNDRPWTERKLCSSETLEGISRWEDTRRYRRQKTNIGKHIICDSVHSNGYKAISTTIRHVISEYRDEWALQNRQKHAHFTEL